MSILERFQNPYQVALRNRAIKDYIKENNRSPSEAQIFELVLQYQQRYPEINTVGFSGYDITKPNFRKESSSEEESLNRQSFCEDLDVVDEKADQLVDLLEDSFRGFQVTANRCNKLLAQIETRLNNLILLHGGADVFLYGVEEDFSTQEHIDLENTTASVEPGYVTLGKDGIGLNALDNARISISSSADKGIISQRSMSSISTIKKKDGKEWEYYVYTNYTTGRVNVVIDVDFDKPEGIYVGDIRVSGHPFNVNSKMTCTVLYSLNGSTYTILNPAERAFNAGENSFSLGKEGVTNVQLLLSKYAADEIGVGGKNIYMFNIDSFEVGTDKYLRHPTSVLHAGPYEIYDENQNPVNFSLATLAHNTCCLTPEKTSVSFFLSKDNINWFPASYTGDSLEVVQFSNTIPIGTYAYINESESYTGLTDQAPDRVDLEYGKEAICNLYITSEWADKFVLSNTYVERNGPQNRTLYDAPAGWFYHPDTQQYSCYVYVEQIEGIYLDLANTSAYINDQLVSGTVSLPQGYHKFSTSYTNWYEVEENIDNVSDLEEADPAYPRNHKLMIEGYNYIRDFSGAKVYNGVGRHFGSLLEYVTPERFNSSDLDGDLDIYTIEEYDGNLYFKVKILSTDASWAREDISIRYMLRLDDTNTIYVKAMLRSNDPNITPHINSVSIRVI